MVPAENSVVIVMPCLNEAGNDFLLCNQSATSLADTR